jgi:ribonuclease HII
VTLVVGTDEAGYGPNLGPLVIGGTAWRVAAEPSEVESALERLGMAARPLWGDSKSIYKAGAGRDALERGVLVALALAGGREPTGWAELADSLGPDCAAGGVPEAATLAAVGLPLERHEPSCRDQAAGLGQVLATHAAALVAVRCRVVQPGEFNALLDRGLNKSDILTQATLDLAAELAAVTAAGEPVEIWCDRHGGRRRYAPQVSRAFNATLVQPLEEQPHRSAYAVGRGRRIEFSVGGERRLPVAVASMTAKYVRELAMLAFNDFWRRRQPSLAATAGYPVDARRWREEAAATVAAAGLGWDAIWRRS